MFYFLSKFLFVLIQPINWLVLLALYGLFGKREKLNRRSKRLLLGLLVLLTNPLLFNAINDLWEPNAVPIDNINGYDIGIVLGGYSNLNVEAINDRLNVSASSNRLIIALDLYRQGKVKKLLLTGGSGNIVGHQENEAQHVAAFLKRLGIPEKDIIIEDKARNTRENMTYTKALIEKRFPKATCLLITSGYHMPRSIACAEKVNLDVDAFPTDFFVEKYEWKPSATIIPDPKLLFYWQKVFKEWIGYMVYDIRGYI